MSIYCIGSNYRIRFFKGYKSAYSAVGLSLIYEILINTVMQGNANLKNKPQREGSWDFSCSRNDYKTLVLKLKQDFIEQVTFVIAFEL